MLSSKVLTSGLIRRCNPFSKRLWVGTMACSLWLPPLHYTESHVIGETYDGDQEPYTAALKKGSDALPLKPKGGGHSGQSSSFPVSTSEAANSPVWQPHESGLTEESSIAYGEKSTVIEWTCMAEFWGFDELILWSLILILNFLSSSSLRAPKTEEMALKCYL
jgi:hypothetical protein